MLLNQTSRLAAYTRMAVYPKAWQEAGRRLRQRVMQSVSIGVRAVLIDPRNHVFLVRHTYLKGWYLPGGGVEAGESIIEALTRELEEEVHVAIDAPPRLHGIFLQQTRWRSHHVVCFAVRDFHRTRVRLPDWEIAETGFFDAAALPVDTTRATRARIDEVLQGLLPSPLW